MPEAPRHSPEDYGEALLALLPSGEAWPQDEDSDLAKFVHGLASVFGAPFDVIAGDFLDRESDPRFTRDLLERWEIAFGLPDPCVSVPGTIEARIAALVSRMTMQGGQSRAFFYKVAAALGYEIEIYEFSPFMAGISEAGDTRDGRGWYRWQVGAPEMRFYWKVAVKDARLYWFRAGSGEAGVDHHLEFALAEDLECVLRRYKPAHTEIVFDYSGLTGSNPLSGTP